MHKKQIVIVSLIIALLVGVTLGIFAVRMYGRSTFVDHSSPIAKSSATKLVFSDEFNNTTLNAKKWNTCYDTFTYKIDGCSNFGNTESEWYTAAGVSMKDGSLVLTSTRQTAKGTNKIGGAQDYGFSSGMVATGGKTVDDKPLWSGTYGYFESRMNVPSGKAMWPAFWLTPVDHKWPPEIDIMEVLGHKPNQLLMTYFWKGDPNYGQPKDTTVYTAPSNLTDSWHTYGLNWQPGLLEWYIDGKLVKTAKSTNVASQPMQIIFDLAVGGELPGDPDETTPYKAKMYVDYVRVYKTKP